jgi:hypothetical protein
VSGLGEEDATMRGLMMKPIFKTLVVSVVLSILFQLDFFGFPGFSNITLMGVFAFFFLKNPVAGIIGGIGVAFLSQLLLFIIGNIRPFWWLFEPEVYPAHVSFIYSLLFVFSYLFAGFLGGCATQRITFSSPKEGTRLYHQLLDLLERIKMLKKIYKEGKISEEAYKNLVEEYEEELKKIAFGWGKV